MKKVFWGILLFGVIFFIRVEAAVLYFGPSNLNQNKSSEVELLIDTEGQEINAVELHLRFSTDSASIESVSDGGSIIPLWIDKPDFSNNEGRLSFSGIIPGGFSGKGLLSKIKVRPKNSANFTLFTDNSKILLNTPDAKEIQIKNSLVTSNNLGLGDQKNIKSSDVYPPESFEPKVINNQFIYDGKWALLFSTVDKDSGIDHYEIMEVSSKGNSNWTIATSPYLLADQSLTSYIYVRAVDKAGNFIAVKVGAKNAPFFPKMPFLSKLMLILLLLTILGSVWKISRKKHAPGL